MPLYRWLATLLLAAALPAAHGAPRINELMAAGQSAIADEDGAFPDWIELHNPGAAPVALGGWALSDDAAKPAKWTIPAVTLAPGAYLVVFCSEKNRTVEGAPLHTNFRLNSGGETLYLTRPDGAVEQTLRFPQQRPDLSFDGADFLGHPTPGAANDPTTVAVVRAPDFSVQRGFQAKPFALQVSSPTPGAVIRYTTDGTEPSPTSPVFPASLPVGRTTCIRAAAFADGRLPSPVVTSTYLFPGDVVKQSPAGQTPPGWPKTWGANRVDYGMDPRIAQKGKFARDLPGALKAIPTMSIVVALPDLFDSATGIYANPENKGREWERPMSLELIHPDGTPGFQVNAGLRIRGGASRSTDNPKHNLRVLMKEEYGAEALDYPLFGPDGAQRTEKFDLRSEQLISWVAFPDENADFIRDIYGRDTQRSLGQPSSRGNFYHLYINGQYWGLYQTDERIGAEYAAEYFGGSEGDYDTVKINYDFDSTGGGTDFIDGSFGAWRRAVQMGVEGLENDQNYFKIQGLNPDGSRNRNFERLIDVDNLIDYMLAGIYIAADDSPPAFGTQNNWYAVRSRKGDFGFRFFAHDWEISMSDPTGEDNRVGEQPTANPFLNSAGGPLLREKRDIIPPPDDTTPLDPTSANPWHFWQAMRMNPEFRLRVADHVQRFFFNDGPLTQANAVARWRARMEEIDQAIIGESARWGDGRSDNGFPGPLGGASIAAMRTAAQAAPNLVALPAGQDEDDLAGDPPGGKGIPEPAPAASRRRPTPYTRDTWLKACQEHILDGFLADRSAQVLQHLRDGLLYPSLDAPAFTPMGGTLPVGSLVEIAAPMVSGGINPAPIPALVYFTTDGNDPRLVGGGAHPDAQLYTAPLRLGKKTTLKARALNALTGEWSALLEATYLPGVDLGGLQISEIFYHPADAIGSNGEYVELHNSGTSALDLSGLRLSGDIAFTFPASTALPPGGRVVIARNSATFASLFPGVEPLGIFTGRLPDSGGRITVETPEGARVLSVKYDDEDQWPAAADGFGFSLVYDGKGDPDDGKNWDASYRPLGTPGQAAPQPVSGTPLLISRVGSDSSGPFVDVMNPGASAPVETGNCWLLHAGQQVSLPPGSLAPGATLRVQGFALSALSLLAEGGEVAVQWGVAAPGGGAEPIGYVHRFEYGPLLPGVEYGRVVTSDGREYFPALDAAGTAPAPAPMRISEVNYFPPSPATPGGGINPVPASEFVELANRLGTPANLSGARLEGLSFEFPAGSEIPANGRALVVTIDPALFRTRYNVPARVPIFGPAGGSLQDNGERVALEVPVTVAGGTAFAVVEELRFNDRHPWPVLAAGRGHSLQRFSGENYAAEPASWGSGEPTPGLATTANAAPAVSLATGPAPFQYVASASDADGSIAKLEFIVDGTVVEESSSAVAIFTYRPTNGVHDLWARATDDSGAVTLSPSLTLDATGVPDGAGRGLKAEFYNNTDLSGTPAATVETATLGGDWFHIGPAPGVSRSAFSVRYTGHLMPRSSGSHSFNFRFTGGLRFYLGGELVLEQPVDPHTATENSMSHPVELVGGRSYEFTVEYFDDDGLASLALLWNEAGSFFETPVPSALWYLPSQDPAAPGIAVPAGLERRFLGQNVKARLAVTQVAADTPAVWSIAGGALPPGLALAADGLLTGAPTADGVFSFTAQASLGGLTPGTLQRTLTMRVVDRAIPPPVVRIVEPGAKVLQAGAIRARGTATSTRPIARVRYSLNGNTWHDLPGDPAWSVLLAPEFGLSPGGNFLRVEAEDAEGRRSPIVERAFERQYPSTLSVSVSGAGSISPGFLGQSTRTVGQEYTITARPAPGFIFAGWREYGSEPTLRFTMSENLSLTADFVPNPFLGAGGTFTAFLGDAEQTHRRRGRIQVTLTDLGEFTGSIEFAAIRYPFKGRLNPAGLSDLYLSDPNTNRSLNLTLAFDPDSRAFSATVNVWEGDANATVFSLLAPVPWGSTRRCPQAGRWNVHVPFAPAPAPAGHGFATIGISPGGLARAVLRQPDGRVATTSGVLDETGMLPFYAALGFDPVTAIGESISGPLTFTSQPPRRALGTLLWASGGDGGGGGVILNGMPAPRAERKLIPPPKDTGNDLFARSIAVYGSPYSAPDPGKSPVDFRLATFRLTAPALGLSIEKTVRFPSTNQFLFPQPDPLRTRLEIDPGNGLVTGQLRTGSGASAQTLNLQGLLNALDDTILGFFVDRDGNTGAFEVRPVQ